MWLIEFINKVFNVSLTKISRFYPLFVFFALFFCEISCSEKTLESGFSKERKGELQQFFRNNFPDLGPGTSVSIYHKGSSIFNQTWGYASLEDSVRLTGKHCFNLGEFSQVFTAASVYQLEKEGVLDLADTLGIYLKEIPDQFKSLRIKDLLDGPTSIPELWDLIPLLGMDENSIIFPKTLLDLLPDSSFYNSSFGNQEKSTKTAFSILGEIIRRASDFKLTKYCKRVFFDPYRMFSASFSDYDFISKDQMVIPYEKAGNEYQRLSFPRLILSGGTGMKASTKDMGSFLKKLFSDDPNSQAIQENNPGWRSFPFNNKKGFFRQGFESGHSSLVLFVPDLDFGMVIMTGGSVGKLKELGMTCAGFCLFNEKLNWNQPVSSHSKENRSSDFSKPKIQDFSADFCPLDFPLSLHVYSKKGVLHIVTPYQKDIELISLGQDQFYWKEAQQVIHLNFDEPLNVKSLEIMGRVFQRRY